MGTTAPGDESRGNSGGWRDLGGSAWTLYADTDASAFADVPDVARARLAGGIPATVPGCVHTDLMAAGLLEDPYLGTNEAAQRWVGAQTWRYELEVGLTESAEELTSSHCDLVCDGLDTIAEVRVNGRVVGTSVNMHRRNTFSVREHLWAGPNRIDVVFSPALAYTALMAETVGERPHVEKHPFNLIRKMACNFGWDWGPSLITAGIWKTIGLRSWDHARIADLGVFATAAQADDGSWVGTLRVDAQLVGNLRFGAVTARVIGGGVWAETVMPAEQWTELELTVSGVQPWWPHSLGDQTQYTVEVVFHNDTAILDTMHVQTGFRTVELDTTPDADGQGATFGFRINGTQIFARGMDWIPDDCFPTRITPQRYRERIQQAKDAHVDLIRVWGGGLYETDDFYHACDELGMLVWQDFALACAAYPEEEPFATEIEAEARDNVVRLSPHPSLVLWNGNNENLWAHEDWGWKEQLGEQTWGADYYYRVFPEVVAELDPSRPYWAGSPSSGDPSIHPNDPNYGCMHIWDVWNARDYTGYGDYSPRFVSEFGYQGPATYATWARTLDPSDLSATSLAMLAHQKAAGGNTKLDNGIKGHFAAPGDDTEHFDDWLFTMQVQQARAVRYGIERWRSLRGRCLGSVVWQLNDCWPVTSWAALDLGTNAAGEAVARRKPLWYAVRSAYADHLVTVQQDGGWRAVLVNDGTDAWTAGGTAVLRGFDGEVLWSQAISETLEPRSRVDVALADVPETGRCDVAIVVSVDGAERAVRPLAEDVESPLPMPRWTASVERTGDGTAVTVTADTFVRSLSLFADRVGEDAWADSLLVDLFPGESHTFQISGQLPEGASDGLTEWPVLRSVRPASTPSEAP